MEYKKCLVELDEILKYLSQEDLAKIPEEIRKTIKEKKDMQYNWEYDESKELKDQNINRKTIAMLSYLNMEYLLNKEQKRFLEELHMANENKNEKEKAKKYGINNIFNNNVKEETALQEIKEKKWYEKLLSFLKKIIRK